MNKVLLLSSSQGFPDFQMFDLDSEVPHPEAPVPNVNLHFAINFRA
jgi:hypothetical protein